LQDIRELRQNPVGDWLVEQKQREHRQLMHKISRYRMYLDDIDISKDWEAAKVRAKARPMTEFYHGKLRKSGGRMIGQCPFHNEKSGSFVIYANNTAHCFGCSWNGDVIDYIQKKENLDFKAAVKLLAQ
jgi:ribosome biogenesis protein Nip4